MREAMNAFLVLDDREARVYFLRKLGFTYREIAEALNRSVERARQINMKAEAKIRIRTRKIMASLNHE
jgi:DNA-directed RNA polymerase sigma subunit (sigma70/sigma32)